MAALLFVWVKIMWFKIQNQQVKINIFAKPNSKKTAILGIGEHGLIISLHAKPDKGSANKELISYLAKLCHLPKTQIFLQRGEQNRHKQVVVPLTDSVLKLINQYDQP